MRFIYQHSNENIDHAHERKNRIDKPLIALSETANYGYGWWFFVYNHFFIEYPNRKLKMVAQNTALHGAKKAKNDEYYTQLVDIENEMKHYKRHFKNKIIYCNCDDPSVSNFFHYFSHAFAELKLKKLITTCYKSQERDLFSKHDSEKAISLQYDSFKKGEVVPDIEDIGIHHLAGDGDFRSEETIALLKQADIVATNPPFSLFREYVEQLIRYNKKFVIIGNKNALTYKEIFKLIKKNKIWIGNTSMSTDLLFDVPENYAQELTSTKKQGSGYKIINGVVKGRASAIWFTNLDIRKRHQDLLLYKKYTPEEYPKYDNYDAINVNKTNNIPMDCAGVMGVPISFLDKYNPDQFEILGIDRVLIEKATGKVSRFRIDGKEIYARIAIKNKTL